MKAYAPIAPPPGLRWVDLTPQRLDQLAALEAQLYETPWTRGNFSDALQSRYHIPLLLTPEGDLHGYYVLMPGVQEAHLLNIAVAPQRQGQGLARCMLDAAAQWARSMDAQYLWLEVRPSNTRARQLYERYGYARVGERKRYYTPNAQGLREDAIVMSLQLWP